MTQDILFWVLCAIPVLGILVGIAMMSRVKTARAGNALSAACLAATVLITLYSNGLLSNVLIYLWIAAGLVVGVLWGSRIPMIQMPQGVALLNGLGGLASALVVLSNRGVGFEMYAGQAALAVGMATFTGSMIAAGKLHRVIPQKPITLKGHMGWTVLSLALTVVCVALSAFISPLFVLVLSAAFGMLLAIRVGGADMPITISLLNSLSGVAAGIAGISIGDPVLIAVGGIVGSSGVLLTQIMCKAMNRSLSGILLGKTTAASVAQPVQEAPLTEEPAKEELVKLSPEELITSAKNVIIVPGYGMALAQAQDNVKRFTDALEARGANVRFAIHPVAGRMPGHMNVLLCEADIPYDKLHEMEEIDGDFAACDLVVVVGANDVINPAANTEEGTPIYGMPILNVSAAPHIIICNLDTNNGYAGVPNPLYRDDRALLMLGDAKETVDSLIALAGG